MGSVRLLNDPLKYIRRVKGRYQARPFLEGERFNLGLFNTPGEAREAIAQFWWGKRQDVPKFTYAIRTKAGSRFFAIVRHKGRVFKSGPFDTRQEASAAARMACLILHGAKHENALKRIVKTAPWHKRLKNSPSPLSSGQLQIQSSHHDERGRCG